MINVFFSNLGNYIWSLFYFPVLIVCSLILSLGCKWPQFRKFGFVLKETVGKIFTKGNKSDNTLSPFQAAATALGSTVGTGNIIGTAQAITMGGPGALFWIWVAALISMIVKYAEICLAIHYRKSEIGYGPIDYIEHAFGKRWPALLYAALALLSSLAMGNLCQASSIGLAFNAAADAFISGPKPNELYIKAATGLILCALTILLLSGGGKRIGKCASALVPFMVLVYIAVSLTVIIINIKALPDVLYTILCEAFKPGSICGGAAGISTASCIQWGIRRSAFSNEAGLGTSAIAHASAYTQSAAKQGLWGIFEVFADTIVICSCTALCILCSGIDIPWQSRGGENLYLYAIESLYGSKLAALLLAGFIGLFAYTSIMSWALYGSRCTSYILGEKACAYYQVLFIAVLFLGSILPVDFVWKISDLINALMSVPNLIAVLILSPIVIKLSRDIFT